MTNRPLGLHLGRLPRGRPRGQRARAPRGRRRRRLDGVWNVERTGGLLPPMLGVHKVIEGARGRTNIGPLPGPAFEVRGRELRYVRPFGAFVDVLTHADEQSCTGRATVFGRTFGSFRMRRIARAGRRRRRS